MADELLQYYQDELKFLREMGAEFREKYPKIAARLSLAETGEADPHVERLLEGSAFLAARIHNKIDDDFPEITDALLNIVYPHYIRPIPSFSIIEFHLDPNQAKLTTGFPVPRGASLYSKPVQGVPCKFRTSYETTLWPIELAAVEWRTPDKLDNPVPRTGAAAVLRMELRCTGEASFAELHLEKLRFYLHGQPELVHSLYEVLLNSCTQILLRDPARPKKEAERLEASSIRGAGFQEDEALLPYPRRSFDGYRLLQEYFTFPHKFHFLELTGLRQLRGRGFTKSVEVLFLLGNFERMERWQLMETGVNPRVFRMGCAPVANLFAQTAEPILLKQTMYEYPIVPDARRHRTMDVFSVDSVVLANANSAEVVPFDPFFSFRHSEDHAKRRTFWHATRRAAQWRKEGGSDMFVSFVDLSGRPLLPDSDAITCRLTCTNRDLPNRLPFGNESGDFDLEGPGPIKKIVALLQPTRSFEPTTRKSAYWRLISHLSLNYLSLVSEGKEALQEILRLYDFTGSVSTERQVQGIVSISATPHFARVLSEHGIGFARGNLVEMELDEENFVGSGVFMFASLIENFLGMYTSMNSFSQLSVRSRQRREILRRWPPRSGRKTLL